MLPGSSHCQNTPEPDFPAHHMVVCLSGFRERKLFDHAVDVVDLRKIDCLFAIQCMAGWPSMYRKTFLDHRDGVESSLTGHFAGGSVPETV